MNKIVERRPKMANKTYKDEKFGTFTLYKYTYDTYYNIEEYKTGNYTLSILVFVDNMDDLKQCIDKLNQLNENIEKLDKLSRKIFIEKLESTEEDLNEIELNGIWYYKDKHFELLYNLPEEVGLEYVKAIFNENNIAIDATMDNY